MIVDDRTEFVLDSAQLGDEERVVACRAMLAIVSGDIEALECDIPWSQAESWPADVRRAAESLSALRRPSRLDGDPDLYRRTGVVTKPDADIWEAFVCFAPYAFDASAWDNRGKVIVSLSDTGSDASASLTREQVAALAATMGADVLIPYARWREERQRRRRN